MVKCMPEMRIKFDRSKVVENLGMDLRPGCQHAVLLPEFEGPNAKSAQVVMGYAIYLSLLKEHKCCSTMLCPQ